MQRGTYRCYCHVTQVAHVAGLTFDIAEGKPRAVGKANRVPEPTRGVDRRQMQRRPTRRSSDVTQVAHFAGLAFDIAEGLSRAVGKADSVPEPTRGVDRRDVHPG